MSLGILVMLERVCRIPKRMNRTAVQQSRVASLLIVFRLPLRSVHKLVRLHQRQLLGDTGEPKFEDCIRCQTGEVTMESITQSAGTSP